MTTPNLEGAKCVGLWELFDSIDHDDHKLAAAICAECPVRDLCAQVLADIKTVRDHANHRPSGTWAGQLIGAPPAKSPCGTEGAYYRHQRNGEPIDEPCKAAHRKHEREYQARRRAERAAGQPAPALAPCGTVAAYKRHNRRGEKACEPCREALRQRRNGEAA